MDQHDSPCVASSVEHKRTKCDALFFIAPFADVDTKLAQPLFSPMAKARTRTLLIAPCP